MTAPLHPRGTLRARFEPVPDADVFRRLGVGARSCDLGDEGLYLAEELVAADVGWLGSSEHPEALAILVLALMIAQRQGSTCLPLDFGSARSSVLRALIGDIARVAALELDVSRVMKTIANLTSAPRFNSVIGVRDARLPLVIDQQCLYTERSRWLEQRVASRIAERLTAPVSAATEAKLDAIMTELTAPSPTGRTLSDEQAHAVRLALTSKLSVVTGGPGTGKTLVAASIVRGFARLGITNIALAAQTGKAANRLTEVIAEQLASIAQHADACVPETTLPAPSLPVPGPDDPDAPSVLADASGPLANADALLAAHPPIAQTLHRLLGYRGGRFAHHAQSPLPVGAVIVDESSMIDLELIDALLDALPASVPLVLIGDAHQLPAIDAGQILADLAEPGGIAAPRVAVLAKSYRMNTSDADGRAVYEAARAIHEGEGQRLVDKKQPLAVARTPNRLIFRGVEWVDTQPAPRAGEPADPKARPHDATLAVAESLWHHFDGPRALRTGDRVFRFVDGVIDPAQRDELEELWRLLSRARILTVTRALETGSLAINDHLHELALDRLSVTGRPDFVPGEPVMVTANDYQRGLFNGDQGIIVRADEGLGRHHYRALFRVPGGELRPFAIEALRDRLELAWALTIHKSQGSELDAIALLLPHEDLPLVTRELLYTGVTRARTGVVIAGARQILVGGSKRRALRYSGLGQRLRTTLASTAG
ncbi:MAG TPA: AAA family ATPase, partial [Kofleriaceae bacterium]|nr:AAA family ATPase [Kofleriaceae bacterium]